MKDVATKLPTSRVFNSTAFLILIVGVVVLGGTVFGLHHVQVRRSAGKLLTQAENAEEDGRLEDAIRNYTNYLGLRPRETDVKARLAKVILKNAKSGGERLHAAKLLSDYAWNEDSRMEDVRTAGEIYAELGNFEEARRHFDHIQKINKKLDAKSEYYIALCDVSKVKFQDADARLASSIKLDPHFLKPYVYRAVLLRQKLKQAAAADNLMIEMIAQNKDSAAAYLERAKYYQLCYDETNTVKYRELAAADIAEVMKRPSDLPELPLVRAKQFNLSQDYANAEKVLREALADRRSDFAVVSLLTRVLTQTRRSEDAVKVIQDAYQLSPLDKDLGWLLADNMIQAGQTKEASELIRRLRSENLPEASLRFLEGSLALREGRWDVALSMLEQVAPKLELMPEVGARAYLALGLCHERFDALEPALSAYRKAQDLNPAWSMTYIKAANVLTSMGRYEEAAKEYKAISAKRDESSTLLTLAGLKISETLQQAETRRNWVEANSLVKEAEKAFPNSLEASMLRVDLLFAQDNLPDAEKLLQTLRTKYPNRIAPWIGLSMVASRTGKMDEALAFLDKAPADPASGLALRLARINYWTKRGGPDSSKEMDKLGEKLESFSPGDRLILSEALVRANISLGRLDQAEQLIKQLTQIDPDSIRYRNLQLEMAGRRNSEAAVVDAIKEIKRIEGERGVIWRVAEARLLIAKAQRGEKDGLDAAQKLVSEIAEMRPDQTDLAGLRADLQELNNEDSSLAINQLQTAIRQGNRQPRLIQRLAQLYVASGRYADADRMLREVETLGALDPSVKKMAAELAFRLGDRPRAAKLARGAVPTTSRDSQSLVWRGRLLVSTDRTTAGLAEAEANFKQAVEVSPGVADYWLALIDFLMASRRTSDAIAQYDKALPNFQGDEKLLFEARANQTLRRVEKAKAAYEALLAKLPEDPGVLRRAAGFYQDIEQLRTAETHWRKLISLDSKIPAGEVASARVVLAGLLGKSGNPADLEEALALVEKNLAADPESIRDKRVKIEILSRQPDRRDDAITVYEGLKLDKDKDQLTTEDRIRAAFLYQAENQWEKAKEEMKPVLYDKDVTPSTISTYIQMLLTNKTDDSLKDAENWVGVLARKQPDSIATAELRARLLLAQDKKSEAQNVLTAYLKSNPKSIELMALLFDRLGFKEDAERLHKALTADAKNPKAILTYARFLGREKRHKEALDLCETASKTLPPEEVCSTALVAVDNAKTDQALNARVAKLIESALESDAALQSSGIPVMLAVVKTRMGQFDAAEASYRATLKERPNDLAVLNNLAWMLALRGRSADALPLIERVISAFGPSAKFLDTRGIVEMSLGNHPQAIKDFRDAIAGRPDDLPAVYFHLAQAQHLAKDDAEAKKSLELGQKLGLNAGYLEPLEQPLYEELVKALGPVK